LFWGIGLRRSPLALGLLNAQRYQTKNARQCAHLHLKAVRGASLCRELCLRRRLLAPRQAPCVRGIVDGFKSTFRILESQVGAGAPAPPLSAALGLSSRRLITAGNEALGRWELAPPHPRFPLRSACLTYARYRGQRSAWQVRYAAPQPRFPLRSASLAEGSLSRATRRLTGGSCRPRPPHFPLRSASLAGGSLPRTRRRLAGDFPHTPVLCCARFIWQTARYRGQRNTCHPARSLAHSHRDHDAA
jgi:hypothetical protein